MAVAKFYLKEPQSKEETLIYLFFSYSNKRLKYSTGEKIKPKFWNNGNQKAKETKQFPEFPELNSRLTNIKSSAFTIHRKLLNDNIEPNNKLIREELDKSLLRKSEREKLDLLAFIEKYIKESESLKSKGTIAAYKTTQTVLNDYCKEVNKKIDFEDIDLEFYNAFIGYLIKKNYSQNTIGKHIKILKTWLNESSERGLNKYAEFKKRKFKRPVEDTEKIYLTKEELDRIYEKDLSNDKQLEQVRDLFIIGCFTGLRFSDFSQLKPENIVEGNKIKVTTEKTGERVIIPLHPYVKAILRKYKNKVPRAMSNPKMNILIKHIGKVAKIKDDIEVSITKGGKLSKSVEKKYNLITTHTARRSFATNLYLADVPAITIMKITGHKTERSFLRYIRVSQEENANKLLNHSFFK